METQSVFEQNSQYSLLIMYFASGTYVHRKRYAKWVDVDASL